MSTRVTKMAASRVAEFLTIKKKNEVKEAKKALEEYATQLYENTIPTSIMKEFEKFPQYFDKKSYLYISGAGLQRNQCITLAKSLPSSGNVLELKPQQSEKFIKLKRAWEDKKSELEKLELDIETAVFNARTYKKVAELFPEAAEHLPAVFPPPAINYADIRKRIK